MRHCGAEGLGGAVDKALGGASRQSLGDRAVPRVRWRLNREALDGYLFILPWVIGFIALSAGPVLASLYLAFTDYELLKAPKFIGTRNFTKMFASDRVYWVSVANTAIYVGLYVPLHLVTALLAAIALNVKVRGINIFRLIFFIPSITPLVASIFLWMWIYNPDYGLANALLDIVGLPPQKWLFDENLAKPSLVIMALWAFGSSMIIFLAGLQGIDQGLYEAAEIDGAAVMQRFRHITLPMLTPVIFFNLVLGIIGTFQVFTVAYVGTQGGPHNATRFYVLYLYEQGFAFLHMGFASAMAWVLFLFIMLLTLVQFWTATRWVYYETGSRGL